MESPTSARTSRLKRSSKGRIELSALQRAHYKNGGFRSSPYSISAPSSFGLRVATRSRRKREGTPYRPRVPPSRAPTTDWYLSSAVPPAPTSSTPACSKGECRFRVSRREYLLRASSVAHDASRCAAPQTAIDHSSIHRLTSGQVVIDLQTAGTSSPSRRRRPHADATLRQSRSCSRTRWMLERPLSVRDAFERAVTMDWG